MGTNPGYIKNIVTIKMPAYRNRTSDDFIVTRDKVFEIFNMKHGYDVEYYI